MWFYGTNIASPRLTEIKIKQIELVARQRIEPNLHRSVTITKTTNNKTLVGIGT